MTLRQTEQPDFTNPWGDAAPDAHSEMELAQVLAEGDVAFDALVTLINAALESCTDRQSLIWRMHTGIAHDGDTRPPMNTQAIAEVLDCTRHVVRNTFNEAHVRVLSVVLAQDLPPDQREAALANLGGRIVGGRHGAALTQLSLAVDAPRPRKGRVDEVPTELSHVDANTNRPARINRTVKGASPGAYGVRFGEWEGEMPRGNLQRQPKEWERFHERQLERIARQREAANA